MNLKISALCLDCDFSFNPRREVKVDEMGFFSRILGLRKETHQVWPPACPKCGSRQYDFISQWIPPMDRTEEQERHILFSLEYLRRLDVMKELCEQEGE